MKNFWRGAILFGGIIVWLMAAACERQSFETTRKLLHGGPGEAHHEEGGHGESHGEDH